MKKRNREEKEQVGEKERRRHVLAKFEKAVC